MFRSDIYLKAMTHVEYLVHLSPICAALLMNCLEERWNREEIVLDDAYIVSYEMKDLGLCTAGAVDHTMDFRTESVKKLLDALRPEIHGMVHCSGGAQTKILHFVGDDVRVIKDNLFPVPPLFKTIHEQSGTDWAEMYKVFNMGHRLEVYISPEHAEEVIAISKSFGIDAQVVGRVEECDHKELIIKSEFGEFKY